MAKLQISTNYGSIYDAAYDLVSKNEAYEEEDWLYSARHGELDAYINLLSRTNEITDMENFKNTYKWDFSNTKTRIAALNNELNADRTNLIDKTKLITDELGNVKEEKFKTTEYDYYKNIIIENNNYEYEKYLKQSEQERKDNMNAFGKGLLTIVGAGSSFVSGFMSQLDNLSSTVISLGHSAEALFKGEDISDTFVKNASSNKNRFFSEAEKAILEFERKYTYLRDVNGNYTNIGKIIGGVGTSLGQMLPSLIVSGGLASTNLSEKAISRISSLIFYTGTTTGNIKDSFEQLNNEGASIPTEAIISNAVIKSGLQYAVEIGLGKILGTSSLDEMVFGRSTKSITSSSLTKAGLRRIGQDFVEEGLEEVFQDTSDFLVDRAYSLLINENFGELTELTYQSLMDAFIIGGIASFAGSVKGIISAKPIETTEFVTDKNGEKIKDKFKKLNKLASWEYGLDMQSFVNNFNDIIQDTNIIKDVDTNSKEGKKYINALTEMYSSYRMLSSIYGEIGEERFKNANKLLEKITEYVNKGKFNTGYIRSSAAELYNSLSLMSTKKAKEKVIEELSNKNITEIVDKLEAGEDVDLGFSNEAVKAAQDILKGDKSFKTVVITKDGTDVVFTTEAVFVPLNYLRNGDVKQIYSTIAEQTLVEEISKGKFKGNVLNEVLDTYEKVSGLDNVTMQEAIYNLMFNNSFFNIMLNIANKDMYQLLTSLVDIEKSVVNKNLRTEQYKSKLKTVIKNMKTSLYNYCINQQNADYRLNIFTSLEQDKIAAIRWSKDLYNRVLNDETFNKLTKNDLTLLENRINYIPIVKTEKDKLLEDIKSNVTATRKNAMNKISSFYKNLFTTSYDGKIYMPENSIPNMCFNAYLRNNNLTIETLLNTELDKSTEQAVITRFGELNEENLLKFRQEQFMITNNNKYTFRFNEQGKLGIYEYNTNIQLGFDNFYSNIDKDIKLDEKVISIRTNKHNDLVKKLLNKSIDDATASYMDINDVIVNPNVLNEQIKSNIQLKYGDINPENTFRYLREHFVTNNKNISLIVLQDGTFAFGNTEQMSKIINDNKLTEILNNKKSFKISEIIDKKYIKGRLKDLIVIVNDFDVNEAGQYNVKTNTIFINSKYADNINYLKFALLHEFQHAIQFENDMNLGMNGNWLNSISKTKRQVFIRDVKKHIPYLFKKIKAGSKEEFDIVNNLIYDCSGEYEANGYDSSLTINFYPFVVNHNYETTTITTPWGTSYDFKTGVKLNLIARNVFNEAITLLSKENDYTDYEYFRNKKIIKYLKNPTYKHRENYLYDKLVLKRNLLTDSIQDYISAPLGDFEISKKLKKQVIEDIDKLELKNDMMKMFYINVVGIIENMSDEEFLKADVTTFPEYDKFINSNLPCIRLQQGSEIYDDAFLSFSIASEAEYLMQSVQMYVASNGRYPNVYTMIYGTIKPTEALGYIGTDLNEALLSDDTARKMKHVDIDIRGYGKKIGRGLLSKYETTDSYTLLGDDTEVKGIYSKNIIKKYCNRLENISNNIIKLSNKYYKVNPLFNTNEVLATSENLYSKKSKFLNACELVFNGLIYPEGFNGFIQMYNKDFDFNKAKEFIDKNVFNSHRLLQKTLEENGFDTGSWDKYLDSYILYVANKGFIEHPEIFNNEFVPVNLYFNNINIFDAIKAVEENMSELDFKYDHQDICYGFIKIRNISCYIPNSNNCALIRPFGLEHTYNYLGGTYEYDDEIGEKQYNVNLEDTSLSTNDFIMQLKAPIDTEQKTKSGVKPPQYRGKGTSIYELEKRPKNKWREYNLNQKGDWISRYPRKNKDGTVAYDEKTKSVLWNYNNSEKYYNKLVEKLTKKGVKLEDIRLKPEKSRRISKKKYTGTNLEKFGYLQKYQNFQLNNDLVSFINNATEDIDEELWKLIKNTELLHKSQVMDYLRNADDIDDTTFELINNSFFKNPNIKTFKELTDFIAKSDEYYALNAVMKSYKIDYSDRSYHGLEFYDALKQQFTKDEKDEKLYYEIASRYSTYKKADLFIDDRNLRRLWLDYFDGSIASAGYLTDIAKFIAITGWKITSSSDSSENESLNAEIADGGMTKLDKIVSTDYNLSSDTIDYLIYGEDRESKIDRIMEVISPSILKEQISKGKGENFLRSYLKNIRKQYAYLSPKKFNKAVEDILEGKTDEEINEMYLTVLFNETNSTNIDKLNDKQKDEANKLIKKTANTIVRSSGNSMNNIYGRIRTIKENLSYQDKKRFLKFNSDIFDTKLKLKEEAYKTKNVKGNLILKDYTELKKLENRIISLAKEVREGVYKSIRAKNFADKTKKEIEKQNEKIKKQNEKIEKQNEKMKKQKEPVIATIEIENNIVNITTTKEMPKVLKDMLSNVFTKQTKSTTQYLTDSTDTHIVMNYAKFVEDNATLLNGLTQEQADELVNYYINSVPIGDTLRNRQYLYTQLYLSTFLINGNNLSKSFTLSDAQKNSLTDQLESMISIPAALLASWQKVKDVLKPEEYIMKKLARSTGIEFDNADINMLTEAINSADINRIKRAKEKMYENTLKNYKGYKKTLLDKILEFERIAMLSGPGTWIRNQTSNIVLSGLNISAEKISNATFKLIEKMFPKKKFHREGQYKIIGTEVKSEVKTFIKNNVIDNGLLELIRDGLNKYDIRKANKETAEQNLTNIIINKIESDIFLTNNIKNDNIRNIYNFIYKMMSDDKYINKTTIKYLGKILTEDNVDLSKGLSNEVLNYIAEAYVLSAQEFMHKRNIISELESKLKERSPKLHFAYKQIFPFAAPAWNWFVEGLNYTPVGLIKSIVNYTKLENTISKMDKYRQRGETIPSSKFAEYIGRKNIGKGIIGSVGMLIGIALAAIGKASIDEEDEKYKLKIGNTYVDISDIFGTQGILLGIAMTSSLIKSDNVWKCFSETLNTMFQDSIYSDFYNLFRYNETFTDFALYIPNNMLQIMIPNFVKTISSVSSKYKVKTSTGLLGKVERLVNQAIPGMSYILPNHIDPYTGEKQVPYKLWFLTNMSNKLLPFKLQPYNVSNIEKEAISLGINKTMLNGRFTVNDENVKLDAKSVEMLNMFYGKLNKIEFNKLTSNRNKYKIYDDKTDKYVYLTYSQMSEKEKATVIKRIMSDNSSISKIYILTQNGKYKYFTNSNEYNKLKSLGIKNIYINNKTQSFVKTK